MVKIKHKIIVLSHFDDLGGKAITTVIEHRKILPIGIINLCLYNEFI